jgi:DNA-binding CsgD family transcriptional regulator
VLDLVDAALRSGHPAEARRHADAVREAGVGALSSRLALVSAGASAMTTRGPDADALFEAAVAVPDAERWPFDLARVRLAHGEHLRGRRAPARATAPLLAALDTFRLLGARPWAARAAAALRAGGVLVPGAPPPDVSSLSELETGIVRMAAEGLTNRQIGARLHLSHRTVGAHLYRVFPRLGVTSRSALPAALAAGDRADPAGQSPGRSTRVTSGRPTSTR